VPQKSKIFAVFKHLNSRRNLNKMASKEKACKICKTIYEEGDKCPKCGSKEYTEGFKGRIVVLNSEKSEIATKLNLKDKGTYAIKTR
jgi:DNA-directed RNA polymerase subunit E"